MHHLLLLHHSLTLPTVDSIKVYGFCSAISLFNVPAVGVFSRGFASSIYMIGLVPGVFHVYFEFYILVKTNFTVCGQ